MKLKRKTYFLFSPRKGSNLTPLKKPDFGKGEFYPKFLNTKYIMIIE